MQVVKRDGSQETFQPEKITRVAMVAGLEEPGAKKLSLEIADWVKTQSADSITSREIRDKVVELLPKYDKYAHDLYVWYEHSKDKSA